MFDTLRSRFHCLLLISVPGLAFWGCNGLETDISLKPDFEVSISSFDAFETTSVRTVDIPNHPEMSDLMEYAVYPDPFRVNEISYQIRDVAAHNTSQFVDLEVSYRDESMDTISLFRASDIPVIAGDRVDVSVSDVVLSDLSQLVNSQSEFLMIVKATGDSDSFGFFLDVFFDTTITVDYDL